MSLIYGKVNKKNFVSLVLFFCSPILSLLYLLNNIKSVNLNFLYILISAIFGLLVLKNPPLYDLIRYLEIFDSTTRYIDIIPYSNYYSFQLISFIFNKLNIPFYVLCFFYTFFIMYFHYKALHILYEKFNWSLKTHLLYILLLTIILNPIFASTILRAYLASGLFFYGCFSVIFLNKFKGYIYCFLAVFFHLSFLYLLVFFVISRFFSISKKNTFIICAISILFSVLFVEYVVTFIPYPLIVDQINNYLNNTNTGADANIDTIQSKIVNFIIIFTHIMLAVLHLTSKNIKNINYNILSNFLNFLLIAGFLSSISVIVFNRYFTHISILSLFLYFVLFNFYRVSYVRIIIISFIIVVNLLIIDIYIRKDSLLNGKPVQMIFSTPLNLFLYSDEEYRKNLSIVDHNGYIKN